MKSLYDHQEKVITDVRESMERGNRAILIQLATGGGKSVIAAEFIRRALLKNNKSLFVVPKRELVRQMDRQFDDFEIPHSFVAAGYDFNPYSRVHVSTAGTLVNRLSRLHPKIVFIDETHHGAEMLDKIIRYYKSLGCFVIGLSATPARLDGRGLNCWYDDMVCGPSVDWLIKNGYLSDFRPFAFGTPNLSQIKTVAGDYAKGQLAELMEHDNALIGDAVKHYREQAIGRLNVTFCTSIKHSQIVCESFKDAGIPAAHIDGKTSDSDKRQIIRSFAKRELLVLTSVDLLHTGFDLSSAAGLDVTVECLSDLRPTKSTALQYQKWGRALRKKPFPALIFDHAGNFAQHGFPDDEREWTLDGVKKSDEEYIERSVANKRCDKCYFTHRPAPVCPNCGNVYAVQAREIDEIDGELYEVDREALREQKRKLDEKKLYQLIAVAKKRGFKNPESWAAKKMTEALR